MQTLRAQHKTLWNKKCHGGLPTKELGHIFGPYCRLRDFPTVRCKHWIKTNQIKPLQLCSFKLNYVSNRYFFKFTAAAHGGLFVQDGQEYEYMTTISSAAGTMDVATHSSGEQYKMKVRLQVAGTKLNVKVGL